MSRAELNDVTDEALAAAHDAHHVAGELMLGRVDAEEIIEAAKQMERTARKLRKLGEAAELAKGLKGSKR